MTFAKKPMTKEEFRKILLRNKNNTSDAMIDGVVDFMIEMKTVEYEEVLNMSSVVFDMFLEGLVRRAKMEKAAATHGRNDVKVFG